MRRNILLACTCIFLFLVFVSPVHAKDSDLELNTEDLKNKEDIYSSLTDINGINLFTSESQTIIQVEENKEKNEFLHTKNILFIDQVKVSKEQSTPLFSAPISFDKTLQNKRNELPINSIVFIMTLISCLFVFILTRKFYKKKGGRDSETNFNFYK